MLEIFIVLFVLSTLLTSYLSLALRGAKRQNEGLKYKLNEKEALNSKELLENASKIASLEGKIAEKEALISQMRAEFNEQKASQKNEYQANLLGLEKRYKESLNELKKEFELNLQRQNSAFLDQNKLMLNEEGKKMLDEIFMPVKKSVKEYSEKLASNEIALQTNIKNMFSFSQEIGKKAEELALILKGDKKIRGNFAEMQLKNVLEHSGLKFGEQYKLQEHFKDENKGYFPDAVVYLDKEKSIIIDAKFSLPSDFDFEERGELLCKELCENLKARIDELAKKPYASFDANTYDFILLFIPYQNILDLALEFEPNLYQEAYKKKIYLTTPHTLFMALNTINISWRHIQSDENIMRAFEELGKFYDKFAGILDSFDAIKRNTNTLLKNVDTMQTQLEGRGGLVSKIERLKELGAKTNKRLDKRASRGVKNLLDEGENLQKLSENSSLNSNSLFNESSNVSLNENLQESSQDLSEEN